MENIHKQNKFVYFEDLDHKIIGDLTGSKETK